VLWKVFVFVLFCISVSRVTLFPCFQSISISAVDYLVRRVAKSPVMCQVRHETLLLTN